ncbi:MAG: FtsX-like permease family protein [Candidatus Liptonbacteria bacterium]
MKSFRAWKSEFLNVLRVGWFLALRQIRRSSRWTTALIIFIMVLTFLNLVVVSGLLIGLIVGSYGQYHDSYSGDLLVTAAAGRDYIENSPALVAFLKNNPHVKAVSARYGVMGSVLGTLNDNPGKNERPNQIAVNVRGIDIADEERVTHLSRSVKYGSMLDENQEGYILLGATMIKKYSAYADMNIPGYDFLKDVDVGSRVRVTLTSNDGVPVVKDFTVKGVVKSKVDEVSMSAFVINKELKRMIPINKDQYQGIAVVTDPGYAPALALQAKAFMGDYSVRIQTSEEAIPSFLRDIETTMQILGNALSSFALVVASITVFIVVFINALTKRKFIGIMKGIGINPLSIEISYMFQALFYGIVGSIIGLVMTFGVLKPYFDNNPIDFPFSDGILVVTPLGAGIRVAILLGVTIFAGFIPAQLIVRKNTLDSILGR